MSHKGAFATACVANHNGKGKLSFDRIVQSPDGSVSVLCDGANSSLRGGDCAELCAQTLCDELTMSINDQEKSVEEIYNAVDTMIKSVVTNSGCTALALQLATKGMCISGCGDSLAEIYKLGFWGWKLVYRTVPQLIEGTNNPSQLMGCPAYAYPYSIRVKGTGRYAILLMSDGLYNFTKPKERLDAVRKLRSGDPSGHDLEFLLDDLAYLAHANGAADDVSGVFAWARYN